MKSVAPVEKKRKKNEKKKSSRKRIGVRNSGCFFFYLRDRLRQKGGTSSGLLVQLVLLLISAPASFLWPTVYVKSFRKRLFFRKKNVIELFFFFFRFSCMFPTNMCFENTVKKDGLPCLFKRYNGPNVPHLCRSQALITRVISSVTVNFAAAESKGFRVILENSWIGSIWSNLMNNLWNNRAILNHICSKSSLSCCF